MPKKKTTNAYFNESVEEAIHLYNESTDDRERNQLFKTIYPALCKMSEVWYNKIKPTYIDMEGLELQADCVTFLLEKMPMIKRGKGKAFSYLTVTSRNYYILNNQIAYKNRLRGYSLEGMPDGFDVEDIYSDRVEQMELNSALFDSFIDYMQINFNDMFTVKTQKIFATAFLEKIKTYGIGSEINRRKILNELADETKIGRGHVTKHINRIASFYTAFKTYYEQHGEKPSFDEKLHISESDAEYIRKNYRHYSKKNGLNGISRQLGINYNVLRNWVKSTL